MTKYVEDISKKFIFLIFILWMIGILIAGLRVDIKSLGIAGTIVICFQGIIYMLVKNDFSGIKVNKWALGIFLILLILALKSSVFLLGYAKPVADYKTFYESSIVLLENDTKNFNRLYLAIFPHVLAYSEVLSILFKVFGRHIEVVVIFNIVVSIISAFLLYFILSKLSGLKEAVIGVILWGLFPSEILWNMLILPEPLYLLILLAIWSCIIYFNIKEDHMGYLKISMIAIIIGIELSVFNFLRPIAAIPIIALLIWTYFIHMSSVNRKKTYFIFILLLVYFCGNKIVDRHIVEVIDTPLGETNWYTINTGLNEESSGQWNQEDWEDLLEGVNEKAIDGSPTPAKDMQEEIKKDVEKRIQTIKDYPGLLWNKFCIMWGEDMTVVDHLLVSEVSLPKSNVLKIICNVFYYCLIIFSLYAACVCFKENNSSEILMIVLYGIGLMLAHLLVEVQGRYHYSALVVFIIMGSYGVKRWVELVKRKEGKI